MPDLPFPIIVAVLFLFSCLAVLHVHMRRQEARRALPLRDEYLSRHGQTRPACVRCRSAETRESGLDDGEDLQRVVVCAKCDAPMYQYRRVPPA